MAVGKLMRQKQRLAVDGYSVPLYKAKLVSPNLVLNEDVKRAMAAYWEPPSFASFIENYGTHIITSVTVGGNDEVFVKLHSSSQLSLSEFENYRREIADQRFSNLENQPTTIPMNYRERVSPLMYLLV